MKKDLAILATTLLLLSAVSIVFLTTTKQTKTTLVFHVIETGYSDWGQIPNATYTYDEVAALIDTNRYDLLFMPQYKGNENYAATREWLQTNFQNKSVMLSCWEGGPNTTPTLQMSKEQISDVMQVCNVKWLRISEFVSWHLNNNKTVPVDYVKDLLTFAQQNHLRVLMSEWQATNYTFQRVKECIAGFEDVVTVAFQTNSEDLEPEGGFTLVSGMFDNWGASIQSWYWTTHYNLKPEEMPIGIFIRHALQAQDMGAQVIQFEPYWYLFDNGEVREELKLLLTMLQR